MLVSRAAIGDLQERADVGLGLRVLLDQRPHLGHDEVRVHVDRLDALAFDQRGPARGRGALPAVARSPTAAVERDAGRRNGR